MAKASAFTPPEIQLLPSIHGYKTDIGCPPNRAAKLCLGGQVLIPPTNKNGCPIRMGSLTTVTKPRFVRF